MKENIRGLRWPLSELYTVIYYLSSDFCSGIKLTICCVTFCSLFSKRKKKLLSSKLIYKPEVNITLNCITLVRTKVYKCVYFQYILKTLRTSMWSSSCDHEQEGQHIQLATRRSINILFMIFVFESHGRKKVIQVL